MQYISRIKSKFVARSLTISLVLVAGLAFVFTAIPQNKESAKAVTCAGSAMTKPQLNIYPITFADEAELCHDYSAIDARLTSGSYSQSQADWNDGLTAADNNEVYVLAYIHNGAANVGVAESQTRAHGVGINFTVPTTAGSDHVVTTTFGGTDTNTVNASFTIHTPSGSKLEVVPNSGELYDSTGSQLLDSGFNPASSRYLIHDPRTGDPAGDIRACFEHSVFVRFKVRVIPQPVVLTNNAICIANVVINPNPALPGQNFNGTVSIRNTGSTTWTNPGYFLAAQNSLFSQNRINIPQSIGPNGQVDFPLTGTLPTTAGTYSGGWQMTQDGVGAFGALCSVTVIINQPQPTNTTLSIVKEVRDVTTAGTFAHSINANNGDTVEYRIKIRNTGSVTANNVVATDSFASGLNFVNGSATVSVASSGNLTSGGMFLGNLASGNEITIVYRATVNQTSGTIVNTATARADNAPQVSDSANVNVQVVIPTLVCVPANQTVNVNQNAFFSASGGTGSFFWQANAGSPISGTGSGFNTAFANAGNQTITVTSGNQTANCSIVVQAVAGQTVNLVFSKKAFNDTRNADAQTVTANREDFITYTLTVNNTGNAAANNFVITDDLSGVLPFANMVDLGGGTLNGNVISYPGVTIPAGGSVSKTFQVRVKFTLQNNLTFVMRNTYGNTVTINIGSVQGVATFVAPKTGAAGTSAAVFAGLITAGFLGLRKRRELKKLIWT